MRKTLIILIMIVSHCLAFSQEKEMVLLPAGKSKPKYSFDTITKKVKSFYLDKDLVTNEKYLEFVKIFPKWRKSKVNKLFADQSYLNFWKDDTTLSNKANPKSPVVFVSWYAAKDYCECQGKRLVTIAEWEYAWDLDSNSNKNKTQQILDWYSKVQKHPLKDVGKGFRTSSGINDYNSLIWEWTADFNSVLISGESRKDGSIDRNLFCGGSSLGSANKSDYATYLRYAFRGSLKAKYSIHNLGFRCGKSK